MIERLRLTASARQPRAPLIVAFSLAAVALSSACNRPPAQQALDAHRAEQPPAPGQIVVP